MKMTKVNNSLLSILLLATIAGCASPIDKSLRDAVTPGVTFSMVFANPDAYLNDVVIWGGSIIKTERTKTGSYVYVLQTDLGGQDNPEDIDTSAGRFIAVTNLQLDPLVYAKGRKVTVAGTVAGKETVNNKKTGTGYTYPLVQADQFYLWKKPEPTMPPYWDSYGRPYWGYDPFWDSYYYDYDRWPRDRDDGRRDRDEGRKDKD